MNATPQPRPAARAAIHAAVAGVLAALPACTPPASDAPPVETYGKGPKSDAANGIRSGLQATQVRRTQRLLEEIGYDVGPIDGVYGPKTRSGILAFQRANQLRATGRPSAELVSRLQERLAAESTNTPVEDTEPAPIEQTSKQTAETSGDDAAGADDADDTSAATAADNPPPTSDTATKPKASKVREVERRPLSDSTQTGADAPTGDSGRHKTPETGQPTSVGDGGNREAQGQEGLTGSAGSPNSEERRQGAPEPGAVDEVDLANTSWLLRGARSQGIRITLKPEGRVEAPIGDWSWARDGRQVRIEFDSGVRSRTVRKGRLVAPDKIVGEASDNFGRTWPFQARRVTQSATRK